MADIKCLNQYPLFLLQKENRLCLCFILFNNNKETFPKNTEYNKNNFQEKIYYFDLDTDGIKEFFNFLLTIRNEYVEDFVLLNFDVNLNHKKLFEINVY